MPIISVIVPVYKVEKYIHRCVDSILAQTFSDFELILVDDGSPDNCPAICDEYATKDSRIHVIHQKNAGISAARNAGIDWIFANSDSQWLSFVDSDDWVHCRFLEKMYAAICEQGVSIACCDYQVAMEYEEDTFSTEETHVSIKHPEDVYIRPNGRGIQAYAWRYMIYKDLFSGIRFPVGKLWEDMFTTPKLIFQVDTLAYVDEKLYYYFCRPDSIVHSTWSRRKLDSVAAVEFNLELLFDHPSEKLRECLTYEYLNSLASNTWGIMRSNLPAQDKRRLRRYLWEKAHSVSNANEIYKTSSKETREFLRPVVHPKQFFIMYELNGVKENISDRIQMLRNKCSQ